jgi:hypothetical protein
MYRPQDEPTANTESSTAQQTPNSQTVNEEEEVSEGNQQMDIEIKVGSESFPATLADNDTARAFLGRLPLTLAMSDVNSNEKAFDFSDALPSNPVNPGRVHNGDLMLYGSRTLVLFYESFSTQYTYTRIGQVDDPANLADALGSGDVEVIFSAN